MTETQKTWLAIEPVDTLFFRGADSMFAGENHEVETVFPPMPSTIVGAIRTAIMVQNDIEIATYRSNEEETAARLPMLGRIKKPGFLLFGPFFLAEATNGLMPLLPAPAHWYGAFDPKKIKDEDDITVQRAAPLDLAGTKIGLCSSVSMPFWIKNPVSQDMNSLAGYWTNIKGLQQKGEQFQLTYCEPQPGGIFPSSDYPLIVPGNTIFAREQRVGIALKEPEKGKRASRTVRDGHLYSTSHIRLRDGVALLVGIESEHPFCLQKRGILQLGGEQRVCHYRVLEDFTMKIDTTGNAMMALHPVLVKEIPPEVPRCGGKILRMAGWDMAKLSGRGFHKETASYFPAGTIFMGTNGQQIDHFACSRIEL